MLEPGEAIPVEPFRLDSHSSEEPTLFELVFTATPVYRYRFGFSVNRDRVNEEWMYRYPRGRQAKVFHRKYKGNGYEWLAVGRTMSRISSSLSTLIIPIFSFTSPSLLSPIKRR
jgi:hypothetical protein